MRRALITGVTGQDGSYLAEFLLERDYKVHGIIRRSSTFSTGRIEHIREDARVKLHYGDVGDGSVAEIIDSVEPDEIYNLAAQSHVATSFQLPEYTFNVNAMGLLRLLNHVKRRDIKVYQACSS